MRKVYKMYSDYKIALPPKKTFTLLPYIPKDKFNNFKVTQFVNKIAKRPKWYEHPNKDPNFDTREYVLRNPEKFFSEQKQSKDPFTNKPRLEWLCASCGCGVPYPGVDLGHRNNWKKELIKAGVRTNPEAQAVFNNLCNLQIECATCNRSHDWED